MEATWVTTQMTPCCRPLPDLEEPMINRIVACLEGEHRKLSDLLMEMASAATSLTYHPDAATANHRAFEVWDEIRGYLWSHLHIVRELLLSLGETPQAIPSTL